MFFCFNPLPHAEGDIPLLLSCCPLDCFNPLPHAEGDLLDIRNVDRNTVSIHSLTQRETFREHVFIVVVVSFNPLPHAEGDVYEISGHCFAYSFNPLPHAEGDPHSTPQASYSQVSIHSLTQRETHVFGLWYYSTRVSIHSLTQRETVHIMFCQENRL